MALQNLKLSVFFLIFLSMLVSMITANKHSSSTSTNPTPYPCPSPTGFANNIIRAPLPSSTKKQVKDDFLFPHLLFFYTDTNIALSEAAFASFCLDQCISYQPDPKGTSLDFPNGLPEYFYTNRTGPCLSFTIDMGKPFPPDPKVKDTELRWYCEAFDTYFKDDLSDFEEVNAPGSYMYQLAVNRACGGSSRPYRAF